MTLIDTLGRKIDYLRLSATDRCNLRCRYCMPAAGVIKRRRNDILSFEELYQIQAGDCVMPKEGLRQGDYARGSE